MKVRLRQSGGFAGLVRGAEVDTRELSPAEALHVEGLVKEVLASPPAPSKERRPDLIRYELTVEHQGAQESCAFDDLSACPAGSKLVALMQPRSGPLTPR